MRLREMTTCVSDERKTETGCVFGLQRVRTIRPQRLTAVRVLWWNWADEREKTMNDETVTITRSEYIKLLKDSKFLAADLDELTGLWDAQGRNWGKAYALVDKR
jgi:hypothetical protein